MSAEHVIMECKKCHAKNRVPLERIDDSPNCGKCGLQLSMEQLSRSLNVTDESFDMEVFGSSLPVVVDCWAPWCGPCRVVEPVLDQLAQTYRGRAKIVKLNLDENPLIGSRYAITRVPTMFLVKNGKIVDTLSGALQKEQQEAHIARIL